jgi:NTP pyrophosphatase (non-canonical NTP hydrolase)
VVFDPDYNDFLFTSYKALQSLGGSPTDQDQILKLMEEVGEVCAAYISYSGTNPRKGPATGHMAPVVQELADVVMTCFVAMIKFGFDPSDLLEQQMSKVKGRHPNIWDVKP